MPRCNASSRRRAPKSSIRAKPYNDGNPASAPQIRIARGTPFMADSIQALLTNTAQLKANTQQVQESFQRFERVLQPAVNILNLWLGLQSRLNQLDQVLW